jgi:hypothetical protein
MNFARKLKLLFVGGFLSVCVGTFFGEISGEVREHRQACLNDFLAISVLP